MKLLLFQPVGVKDYILFGNGVAAEDHQPFNHVAKLPYVSCPRHLHQLVEGLLLYGFPRVFIEIAKLLHKAVDHQRYILKSLAKRRDFHDYHAEAMEKVFTESTAVYFPRDIFVGSGYNPHVHGYIFVAADTGDLPLLQYP